MPRQQKRRPREGDDALPDRPVLAGSVGQRHPSSDNPEVLKVYEALLRVGSVWNGGDGWTCPAHEDNSPSLSVNEGQAHAVVMYCHAGCTHGEVLAALKLDRADAAPPRTPMRVVATYDYTDRHGKLLFRVDRLEDESGKKEFRQGGFSATGRRRTGKGAMDGVERVLWKMRLVALFARTGKRIFVVEGEKSAQVALSVGLRATTAPGGSSAPWLPAYTEALRGARLVTVVADRDRPGYKHAAKVYDALFEAGIPVEAVVSRTTEPHDDLVDHLAAGYSIRDLLPMRRPELEAPTEVDDDFKLMRASDIRAQPVRWLWRTKDSRGEAGLLPRGELCLTAGREGIGKSMLTYQVCADISRGRLTGESFNSPRDVVVVATEDSWAHTIKPRLVAAGADLDRIYSLTVQSKKTGQERGLELSLELDLDRLERAVAKLDAAMVVLDPLMSRVGGEIDTHKDSEVRRVLEPIRAVADRTGCVVLGIIHVNKGGSSDPLTSIMGSRAFTAVARSVLFAMRDPDDASTVLLGQPKNNLGREMEGCLAYRIDSVDVEVDGLQINTGQLSWQEPQHRSIREAAETTAQTRRGPTKPQIAAEWLEQYLESQPGQRAPLKQILADAQPEGIKESQLFTAKREIFKERLVSERASELHGEATWRLIRRTLKLVT